MSNWTIGKRITAGFASVICIALLLGGFAYNRIANIRSHSERMNQQSLPALQLVYLVKKNAKDQVEDVYRHIGSEDKEDKSRLEHDMVASANENTKTFEHLDKLVTSRQGRDLLGSAESARLENNRLRAEVLALSQQITNEHGAYQLSRSQYDPANAKYIGALDTLVEFIKTDADQEAQGIQTSVQSSQFGIVLGLALACLVGGIVAVFNIRGTGSALRRIATDLGDGSNQVASAAGQISSSSQTLADGSSEQAASLEETSSSLEEMSAMTRRNSENARKAEELAKQARGAADHGAADMKSMSAAMEDIKVSSDDIAKIIKTIDEIAFQTNILALNAAVEAARAGEAGMGFAVVADEVRSLAQRSAQAAKETAGKIEGAIGKTAQGVAISARVAQALEEIVLKVRQVDELVAEVASASREQTEGITQINSAVSQMDKVTQSNAASAEQGAAAAEELNAQAESMKGCVQTLLQFVGRSRHATTAAAAPSGNGHKGQKSFRNSMPKRTASNGNGSPAKPQPVRALAAPNGHRGDIPMDGDFKDF